MTADYEALIGRGLVDDGHRAQVPALEAALADPTAAPADRFAACLVLTAWGETRGYDAVVAAAREPERPPWGGPVDGAFGALAAKVGLSDGIAVRNGTDAARHAALRALTAAVDRVDFADQLGAALCTVPPSMVAADIAAAARRGLDRLDRAPWPLFDLPGQIVDVLEPLLEVDEQAALALAAEVVARDPSPHTLGYVAFLVVGAISPAAAALEKRIVALGGDFVRDRLAEARLRPPAGGGR